MIYSLIQYRQHLVDETERKKQTNLKLTELMHRIFCKLGISSKTDLEFNFLEFHYLTSKLAVTALSADI